MWLYFYQLRNVVITGMHIDLIQDVFYNVCFKCNAKSLWIKPLSHAWNAMRITIHNTCIIMRLVIDLMCLIGIKIIDHWLHFLYAPFIHLILRWNWNSAVFVVLWLSAPQTRTPSHPRLPVSPSSLV